MRGSDRRLERVCEAIALVASLGFAAGAFWELADSFGAGHFAAASAVCTAAENMWRWGVLGPVPHALNHAPAASEFYCHHPWGIFWVSALFMKVFGHHAWACRLPAALQSSLTVPVLYLATRALWSPVAGAVAAVSFAVLPIALSFSGFNALEVPVIFGVVLSIWGFARFRRGYRKRDALLALSGLTYAVCCDWAALIFAGGLLGCVFAGGLLLRRWTAPVNVRRMAAFFGLGVLLCALSIGGHLAAFASLGQLNELFAQGRLRSTGADLPLRQVLAARKFWIDVSFTGLSVWLGKAALPVLVLRTWWRRSELEALPLAVFAMAAFQYVVFKQGADIHIFWPHYFALYFALASAALVQTAADLTPLVARWFSRQSGERASAGWLALGLVVPFWILPDGLRALAYAHRSGGRFNEHGHLIKSDKDKVAALEWLTLRLPAGEGVTLHPGMRQSLWVDWSLQRPVRTVNHLENGRDRYSVADLRFMSASEQDALARSHTLTAMGPFLALDRTSPPGPLSGFAIVPRAPSRFESYWVSQNFAQRHIEPDPFLTWELRDRFGLTPNPAPGAEPETNEQRRVMHNVALQGGDTAAAAHWLEQLLQGTDRTRAAQFEDGNALLATRLERGPALVCTVYFRSGGPDPSEPELVLRSRVVQAPGGSLVARDETVAEVGMPFAIPTSRWKAGYVYSSVTEIIRRIGTERWDGTFRSAHAPNSPAPPMFELLRLD